MGGLLTRDEFRNAALKRDKSLCVICKAPAVDVHHIIERRLFSDGGYYLDNAASLCAAHHIQAEETILTCDEIRKAVGISEIIVPEHLDHYDKYDKWGNIILSNGKRVPGELFDDRSVQKILYKVLDQFTQNRYVKAPRTSHLPWSESKTPDDRTLTDVSHFFSDKKIIITVKMDGESTTCYNDHIHARSLDSVNHPSRNWMKNFHAKFAHDIPKGWRIVGENLYAKHSIHYQNLPTYFMVHSIWCDDNIMLNWFDTTSWCYLLGLQTAPVIAVGKFPNEKALRDFVEPKIKGQEGYVVRPWEEIHYKDYGKKIGKFVRKDHVKSPHNWKFMKMEINHLSKKADI